MFENYMPLKASDYLKAELEARKNKNRQYSLRAFARDLNLGTSTLSDLMKDKIGLSQARAEGISKALKFTEVHALHFVDLMSLANTQNESKKQNILSKINWRLKSTEGIISNDEFELVADWHNFAVLEILKLHHGKIPIKTVAKKLGISQKLVTSAIERLVRLNLIEKEGDFYKTPKSTKTIGNHTPNLAIQKSHQQILKKAQVALVDQNVNQREFQSVIFSLKKSDLPEFKKDLFVLSDKLIKKYYQKDDKDETYCLSYQLFSFEKNEDL